MYNYGDLNDIEFEYLCQDIIEKKLNIKLYRFAQGKDGGIDLTNSVISKEIIVQVKHYFMSTPAQLLASLKKEQKKLVELNPKKYYVCCSKNLSPQKKKEIYDIFSIYMESDDNIITLNEIEDFLICPNNSDILDKNFKLWLHSSDVLSKINNRAMFIDCEVLLYDIKETVKLYVQTSAYNECLHCLKKNRIILILGMPGIGKTITSKMLALKFSEKGYTIRYVTSNSIEAVKKALSSNPEKKELVLLDDCLGQYYFSLKENQESEMVSLIKYISIKQNKMIIMNSRVTIYNESKNRSLELSKLIEDKGVKIHTIDMDDLSELEKAKILYNHLYFNTISTEYYNEIKKNKNYSKIISHKNYNPRIIEFIARKAKTKDIPYNKYIEYIINSLENPYDIWNDEYSHKLSDIDRIYINTLFSLTDTDIESDILEKCFNHRISNINKIDTTINRYDALTSRLNNSFIKIIDKNGIKRIGVMNPSVNDFLNYIIRNNSIEVENIINYITNINQVKKMLKEQADNYLIEETLNGNILDYVFKNKEEKVLTIVSLICRSNACNHKYASILDLYLSKYSSSQISGFYILERHEIVSRLFNGAINKYYKIIDYLNDKDFLSKILDNLYLGDLIETIKKLFTLLKNECNITRDFNKLASDRLIEEMEYYPEDSEISEFISNYNISEMANNHTTIYYDENMSVDFDEESLIDEIHERISNDVYEELLDLTDDLPESIKDLLNLDTVNYNINTSEIGDYINSWLEPEPDEHEYYHINTRNDSKDEIATIFEK